MKDVLEIRTEHIKSLAKRKNFLTKKFSNQLASEVPKKIQDELQLIDTLLADSDVPEEIYQSSPKMVTIRNSKDEEWYFQQLLNWLKRHPDVINGQFARSTIYKFTLHFFVENIVLNSKNANLSMGELASRLNALTQSKNEVKLTAQNKNIEESLSFIMAMIYRQLDSIPESMDATNEVQYMLNPMSEIELKALGTETELEEDSELAKSFAAYKSIRFRDKQRIQQINQERGIISNE
ncbi:hypothetical protein FGL72_04655 [Leuconostoc citreum]|uniref:hypothetical protein n=1 Tax=Leuconostoc citreum TaxID=33964 RepID=UPI0011BB00E0|nr:hypothetical protein [Leuconostoc citreum]QEA46434.1 hypothetical protein FGL82_08720 [Leuconostoc citreum]QEA63124.1 hypothetical protein FGL72_04655 [Leuconostoc citreum]